MTSPVTLGAVTYDPKVLSIWTGFRAWFRERGCEMDFILYSDYERQVEALVAGQIDLAWNSPLAWIRTQRLAPQARALVMRNTDRDLTSIVVVKAASEYRQPRDLVGTTVGTGAQDSPQATLIPLQLLTGIEVNVRHYNEGLGLHGDNIEGERAAARALASGEIQATCMLDASHLLFGQDGTLSPGSTRIVAQTEPFDHCNMTAIHTRPEIEMLCAGLLAMDYADPTARPLMDLEGLTSWVEGRETGYRQLESAVNRFQFYDSQGSVKSREYRGRISQE